MVRGGRLLIPGRVERPLKMSSNFEFRIGPGRSDFRHGMVRGGRLLTSGRVERPLKQSRNRESKKENSSRTHGLI